MLRHSGSSMFRKFYKYKPLNNSKILIFQIKKNMPYVQNISLRQNVDMQGHFFYKRYKSSLSLLRGRSREKDCMTLHLLVYRHVCGLDSPNLHMLARAPTTAASKLHSFLVVSGPSFPSPMTVFFLLDSYNEKRV